MEEINTNNRIYPLNLSFSAIELETHRGEQGRDRYKNKKGHLNQMTFFIVVSQGFEPRTTEPKSAVLPLHHETNLFAIDFLNCVAKIWKGIYSCKYLGYFFYFFSSQLLSAKGLEL